MLSPGEVSAEQRDKGAATSGAACHMCRPLCSGTLMASSASRSPELPWFPSPFSGLQSLPRLFCEVPLAWVSWTASLLLAAKELTVEPALMTSIGSAVEARDELRVGETTGGAFETPSLLGKSGQFEAMLIFGRRRRKSARSACSWGFSA